MNIVEQVRIVAIFMAISPPISQRASSWGTRLSWFSIGPLSGLVLVGVLILLLVNRYQGQHENKIYTGVYVNQIDLSELSQTEGEALLLHSFAETALHPITVVDPASGREWVYQSADLGLTMDAAATISAAFEIGRSGSAGDQLLGRFNSWYYGIHIAPTYLLDESLVFNAIEALADEVSQQPTDAAIQLTGDQVSFSASQIGRGLDKAYTYDQLLAAVMAGQPARIELLIHENKPRIFDATAAASEIATILSAPMSFYLQTPIEGLDLTKHTIDTQQLRDWLRIELLDTTDGTAEYNIFVDEGALTGWLSEYAATIERDPENARFYFDDPTKELVLVEPHVNGRELNIAATIAQFNQQIQTPNRSVPLIVTEIVPDVHSDATAGDLNITELVGERTTWFYGSSNNRKHNIARAASNFYGLVVKPGEEFSFNKYIGDISLEDGYETGLVIIGGQTIEGVGGGVCQVSTTLFQTVFWAGLDIGKRLEHGYQVGYYNDGEGAGMDATVFNPLVDFTFTNNTENYLLIENYYNAEFESLTFKIYSTDIGRNVVKSQPVFENVQEPPADRWVFNDELGDTEIRQVEWAAEGARVTIERTVYNNAGDVRDKDFVVSNYIPWGNVYEYGAGIDPNNLPYNWGRLLVDE